MINFLKYKLVYLTVSLLALLLSGYFLISFGLNPAVDFTGGTLLELEFENNSEITQEQLTQALEDKLSLTSVQQTDPKTFIIRSQTINQATNDQIRKHLAESLGSVTEKRFEAIGPTLGKELIVKTLIGVSLAAGLILVYVGFRFKDKKYGICAILAMLHDMIIVMGAFSFVSYYFSAQADSLFVTAVLTILSFSVHDTIVVYDRIREAFSDNPNLDYVTVFNKSITETLARSINNSLTIIFMLLSLFLLGGESIKWFVFALLVGTITGTYSSTFTAVPLLAIWEEIKAKKLKQAS